MVNKNTEPTIITTTPAIIYGRRFMGMMSVPEESLAVVSVVELAPEVSLLPEADECAVEEETESDEEWSELDSDTLDVVELKESEELFVIAMDDDEDSEF